MATEILERLFSRRTFGVKFGLHVEEALLRRLGNPEATFGIVHVAGTNGKGSVCALVESILRAAGFKTGLYTSPHLVRLNERICVNGQPIADEPLYALIREIEEHSRAVTEELKQEPTFFEFVTALGFEFFRRQKVQVAVVETGMGGRLDATNVVTPLVSVITGIGLEHTAYLGPDIEAIAGEKSGIIKAGRPVVCGDLDEAAMGVVRRTCRERGASLCVASETVAVNVLSEALSGQTVAAESGSASYGKLDLPLLGRHQAGNLAMALAVIERLGEILGVNVPEAAVKQGVASVVWPGRFQVLGESPPFIVDGAHNPAAAIVLADTLKRVLKKRPVGLVAGMCADKDVAGFLKPFSKMVKRFWIVPISNERNMDPARIRAAAEGSGWAITEASVAAAVEEAKAWAREAGGAVCVTGSLFLVGEVLGGGAKPDPN